MLLDKFFAMKLWIAPNLDSGLLLGIISRLDGGKHGEEYIWVSASVMCNGRCFSIKDLVILLLCSTCWVVIYG